MKIKNIEEKIPKFSLALSLGLLIISLIVYKGQLYKSQILGLNLIIANPILGLSGSFISLKNKNYGYLMANLLLALSFLPLALIFQHIK